jgi:hypothetical protein
MEQSLLLITALCCAFGMLVLGHRTWAAARRQRASRAGFLDVSRGLFAETRLRVEPSGFPRLAGRFESRAVDLRAVPDALTFRKLPALWLLATLTEPQPLAGETRVMLRPSGLEPFSTFATLPEEAPPPPGLPPGAVLRTTARAHMPPASVLAGLAPLFADPALKEVVFAPSGLRLVRLAEETSRGAYLLFREVDLGREPADPAKVRAMLDALLKLAKDLADATAGPTPDRPLVQPV